MPRFGERVLVSGAGEGVRCTGWRGFDRRLLLQSSVLAAVAGLVGVRGGAAQDADEMGVLTVIGGGLDTRSPVEPENNDVLIIARIDVPNQTVRAVNVPRDLYVQIPGWGWDKVTRAYDVGAKAAGSAEEVEGAEEAGMETLQETVAVNFGVESDGAVLTTFDGFVRIIDAVGGVEVVNPYELYDAEYPTPDYGVTEIYFPAGPLTLNGEDALAFCRTRHQDGDDGRVMRQELVLRALLEKVQDPAIVADLPDLAVELESAVRTNLSTATQLGLVAAAAGFSNSRVTFGSLAPYLWSGFTPEGMWVYNGDWNQLPGLVQGFLDGSIASL